MPKVIASAPNAGGRHQRGRRVGPTLAEINVIPLVDVMLVLLIIFMVAAPMLQRGVEVKLPTARQTNEISSERIFVDVPKSFRDDKRVFLGKEPIGIPVLAERLRQQLVNRTDKHVFLRGDGDLYVQNLIDVLDQLKAAGVENVGIVTELPNR
jgi:biopolymer transport protein ExbD